MFGQTNFRKFVKAAIIGEVVLCLGAYRVWHQMNTSRGTGNACNIWKALVNTQNSEKLWQSYVPAWPAAVDPYWLIMKIDEFCSEPMLRRKGDATFSHEKTSSPTKSTMHQSFETLGPPPYPPPPHTHTHSSLLGDDWCIHFYASESVSLGLKWMVNPSCLYASSHTVPHRSTSSCCDTCKTPNGGFKWVSEPP